MELEATVRDGVFVPNGECPVPEGTVVRVIVPAPPPSVWDRLNQFARDQEQRPCDWPEDLAANHDHYFHGQPRRE